MLKKNGQLLEALGLLQAILPEAKLCTANPYLCGRTMFETADVLLDLDRNHEAHEVAAEAVAFHKAKFGLEDPKTLAAVRKYAIACAELGRVEEAKTNFEDVLATQTRVLGREHPSTQITREYMQALGFAEP